MSNIKNTVIICSMILFSACYGSVSVSDPVQPTEQSEVNSKFEMVESINSSLGNTFEKGNSITEFTVLEVIDLTTMRIFNGTNEELIRLCGISADVVEKDPNLALVMQNYLKFRLLNKKINIEEDPNCSSPISIRKVYVFAEGEFLNRELLSKGYGTFDFLAGQLLHGNQLDDAQSHAREKRAGVWKTDFVSEADAPAIKMGCGTLPCPPK